MNRRHAIILVKNLSNPKEFLLGKRKDNGKINFPAGGINDGEEPKAGAERELLEETGFKAKNLKLIGTYNETSKDGSPIMIYVFSSEIEGKPTLENDPDLEFQSLFWANPLTISSHDLHIPIEKNSGLKALTKLI